MIRHFTERWKALTIKKKISVFTGVVFIVCLLSVIFDAWVVNFSLTDFNRILDENAQSIQLLQALEEEAEVFAGYIQSREEVSPELFEEATRRAEEAVYKMPFSYETIGETRYALTWSIRNSYEVYREHRISFLKMGKENPAYVQELYDIYDMQSYLIAYANNLMTYTLEAGNEIYGDMVPMLLNVPWMVVAFGCILFFIILKLSNMMNKTIISPIMKLVASSKQIANNDFFTEDVQVENQDELGELVHAFNKMKYATGEYIMALEEKRKTLDLLHSEELEKLAMENQLEIMKLELLKSQVNPHFLFNTLNVISGMANLEDAQTTEKMIKALSSLFRYNLKTSDFEVPLARELKVVEDYMYLQQMRFGDRITYDIHSTVDDERAIVPAFTFQPLVENCIIHGLSRKEEGGNIRIRISQRNNRLFIYIGDNGRGIERQELEALRESLAKQKDREEGRTGIGLGNIYRRVYSMYPDGGMELFSKINAGMVVKIIIPQKSEV